MNNERTYAIINVGNDGSTGKISLGLHQYLKEHGINSLFCYGRGTPPVNKDEFLIDHKYEVYCHYATEKITGQMCRGSVNATKRLISYLKENKTDGVFLLNMHGYYLNAKLLFDYLIAEDIDVVWLMVDEAPYLGNCTYKGDCDLYNEKCLACPNLKSIQRFFFGESSNKAYLIKEKVYPKLKIVFVAPEFVVESAKKSPLLLNKDIRIVDEAIDVSINRPRNTVRIREELRIPEDKIIIGCVSPYSYERKGVKFFIEAARQLEKDDRFIFFQVGYDVNDKTHLPSNYIPIGYVNNQELLTEYYSLADLFVFPSLLDTMPNACLEALACGTPLLCYNTSGMPYIGDDSVMTLVEPKDVEQMVAVIKGTSKKNDEVINTCRNYALNRYDNKKYFGRLMEIMDNIDKKNNK